MLINKATVALFFIFVAAGINQTLWGQDAALLKKEQPKVLKAVAPRFIPFAFDETGVAEFLIEVKLNPAGNVTSAKTFSFSLFKDKSLEEAAKKWIFEEDASKQERIAYIKFVMRIMPKETEPAELTTIFHYPTEVEIRHVVYKAPTTIDPDIIEKEMPSKKKPMR